MLARLNRSALVGIFACAALILQGVVPAAARAEGFDPSQGRGKRIAWESLAGTGGFVVGGLTGAVCGVFFGDGHELIVVPAGLFVGAVFESRTIQAVGDEMGANGSFRWTLLGAGIGAASAMAIGTTMMLLTPRDERRGRFLLVLLVSALVLPTAGGVIAYELSTKATPDSPSPPADLVRMPPRPMLFNWGMRF